MVIMLKEQFYPEKSKTGKTQNMKRNKNLPYYAAPGALEDS